MNKKQAKCLAAAIKLVEKYKGHVKVTSVHYDNYGQLTVNLELSLYGVK